MRLIIVFLFLSLSAPSLLAQKERVQRFDAAGLSKIAIQSDAVFEINIKAIKSDQVAIASRIDGESFEYRLVQSTIKNGVLYVETLQTPDYIPFNDKLSAHKVISIVLEILVPEGIDLDIYSSLARVQGDGAFGEVAINLGRGDCKMTQFAGSGTINTIAGGIFIETNSVLVTAKSRNGIVQMAREVATNGTLALESINGDITVNRYK